MMAGAERCVTDDELAALLLERAEGERLIVAIAGPPGVGKSTFAETLCTSLNAQRAGLAAVLGMDGFHYDDMLLAARGWRSRKGAPHTFDVGGLAAALGRLKRNAESEVAVPVFDRSIEIARAGAQAIGQDVRIVLVEGNYLLLKDAAWAGLAGFFDVTVRLAAPQAEIERRLEARWRGFGLSASALAEKLRGNDLINLRTVEARSRAADFVLATDTDVKRDPSSA